MLRTGINITLTTYSCQF